LHEQRDRWLEAIKSRPELSTTEIRAIHRGLYAWLYRNDRVWLQQHSQQSRPRSIAELQRVDWSLRDLEASNACLRAAMELLEPSQRLIHITRTAVIRKGGYLAVIQKHQPKLPLTSMILGRLAESREGFAIRRIWATASKWKQTGYFDIVRWQLIRASGTNRVANLPQVSNAIDHALAWLRDLGLPRNGDHIKPSNGIHGIIKLKSFAIGVHRLKVELQDA
jgi:hypothetical protein